jgi:hypothetical protein
MEVPSRLAEVVECLFQTGSDLDTRFGFLLKTYRSLLKPWTAQLEMPRCRLVEAMLVARNSGISSIGC